MGLVNGFSGALFENAVDSLSGSLIFAGHYCEPRDKLYICLTIILEARKCHSS